MRGTDVWGGGCARVRALLALRPSPFWALVSPACLPGLSFAALSLLLDSAFPRPPPPLIFFPLVTVVACALSWRGAGGGGRVWVGVAVGVPGARRGCWCVPVSVLPWTS